MTALSEAEFLALALEVIEECVRLMKEANDDVG